MKKIMLLAAGLVTSAAFALIAGCASLTPVQIAGIACPPTQNAITQFQTIDASMPDDPRAVKADALLTKAKPVVAAMCTNAATVTTDNVQDFAQSALPALGTIAGMLPLDAATLKKIQDGLTAAETAVGVAGVIAQNIAAAQAQQAASAPAATQ